MRQQGMSLPTLAMHVPGFLRSPQVQLRDGPRQLERGEESSSVCCEDNWNRDRSTR